MEEKEIIKWKGNLKKPARIICIVFIILLILLFIFNNISISKINNYSNKIDKIKATEEQLRKDSSKLSNTKSSYKNMLDKLLKEKVEEYAKSTDGLYVAVYKNYKEYYIDNTKVTEEEFQKKVKEFEEQAIQTQEYKEYKEKYDEATKEEEEISQKWNKATEERKKAEEQFSNYSKKHNNYMRVIPILKITCAIIVILTIIFYFYISKMEIVVTNTRVYGKTAFGKRVDLPIDTISAVGTSFLKGISIGTSAGKIKFLGITNNKEIHEEISKLLNNRQSNKQDPVKVNNISTTEELKQYKELLDNGVITQEEFEKKKKQILGI